MTGHIFINGEIGDPTLGTTVKNFKDQINPQAEEHLIHINSIGGDVYEGYQIGFAIRSLPNTTAVIEGQCASIATYIATCAKKVIMSPHGDFMIHYPMVNTSGRADDLRKAAVQLDRIKNEIIDQYMTKVSKKGVTRDQLDKMMNEETSMSAIQAKEMGFVDEIKEKLKAVAKFDITKINMTIDQDQRSWFEKKFEDLTKSIKSLVIKPKNISMTLEDGTEIMIMSEEGPAEGVSVTTTDGQPLPAGEYKTVDGISITVDENSVITQVTEMENIDDLKTQLSAKDQEIAQLKEQLSAQSTQSTEAEKKAQEVISNLKKDIDEVKTKFEALVKTPFGDQRKPKAGDPNKQQGTERPYDPMAELGEAYLSRH